MKIAVLKEVKVREGRVVLIPSNIKELTQAGHSVFVQKEAGILSGFSDAAYVEAGATIVADTQDIIEKSDLILKVKEPTIAEVKMMRPGQIFFGYLHLAPIPETLQAILDQKIHALGFETLQLKDGSLPLLAPMSEIAGRLATENGAYFMHFDQGGRGALIGGTKTVPPANVLILGAGVVGHNAAEVAVGMRGNTTVLDLSQAKLDQLQKDLGPRCKTLLSTPENIEKCALEADLIIGSVLIAGEKAPKLISEELIKRLKKGTVVVDVSVDQGGCIETSEVTTHETPIVIKHGVSHYGVANMPGSVPITSTLALNHASFPYIKALADQGIDKVCQTLPEMQKAMNCSLGQIIHPALQGIL